MSNRGGFWQSYAPQPNMRNDNWGPQNRGGYNRGGWGDAGWGGGFEGYPPQQNYSNYSKPPQPPRRSAPRGGSYSRNAPKGRSSSFRPSRSEPRERSVRDGRVTKRNKRPNRPPPLTPELQKIRSFLEKANQILEKNEDSETSDLLIHNVLRETLGHERELLKCKDQAVLAPLNTFLLRCRDLEIIVRYLCRVDYSNMHTLNNDRDYFFGTILDLILNYFRNPEQFYSGDHDDEIEKVHVEEVKRENEDEMGEEEDGGGGEGGTTTGDEDTSKDTKPPTTKEGEGVGGEGTNGESNDGSAADAPKTETTNGEGGDGNAGEAAPKQEFPPNHYLAPWPVVHWEQPTVYRFDDKTIDYKKTFTEFLRTMADFVEQYMNRLMGSRQILVQKTMFTVCGKRFIKRGEVPPETSPLPEDLLPYRDRIFDHLVEHEEPRFLCTHQQATFVILSAVPLAGTLKLRQFPDMWERFFNALLGPDTDTDAALKDTNASRICGQLVNFSPQLGRVQHVIDTLLEHVDTITKVHMGTFTLIRLIRILQTKEQLDVVYDAIRPNLNMDLLTRQNALVAACIRLHAKQAEFMEDVLSRVLRGEEDKRGLFEAMRNVNSGRLFAQLCMFDDPQKMVTDTLALTEKQAFEAAITPAGSAQIEGFLRGQNISEEDKATFLKKLTGRFSHLATNKHGSFVLDRVLACCSLETIRFVAAELSEAQTGLALDQIGRFINLHWGLHHFKHRRAEWEKTIASSRQKKTAALEDLLADKVEEALQAETREQRDARYRLMRSGGRWR